jgi:Tol biopolymer transport system component
MSASDDRRVSAWIHEYAEHRVPAHLERVLTETSGRRQRPAWSSPERWLPMDLAFMPRPAPPTRAIAALVVVGLLIVSLVVALLTVGARPRVPAPYGPAEAGLTAVEEAGVIYLVNPVTGTRTSVTSGRWAAVPEFSPDGTKLSFYRRATTATWSGVVVVANADGSGSRDVTPQLPDVTSGGWSGDGAHIALTTSNVRTPDPEDSQILVVDVAQGTSRALDVGMSADAVLWLPPNDQELVFRGRPSVGPAGLFAVRPDGTGLRPLTPADDFVNEAYTAPVVSPDGRHLAYQSWNRGTLRMDVFVRDLETGTTVGIPGAAPRTDLFVQGFSPDGRQLLVIQQARDADPPEFGGTQQLLLVPADGHGAGTRIGPPRSFTSIDGRPDMFATFSVDGSQVLLLEPASRQLWRLPVAGGSGTVEPWTSEDLPATQRVTR